MSTIKALVPYRTETFRSNPLGAAASGRDRQESQSENHGEHDRHAQPSTRHFARPARSTAFLVQLMASTDAALRGQLGRTDVAIARQDAYGSALANRPSGGGLRFLHSLREA